MTVRVSRLRREQKSWVHIEESTFEARCCILLTYDAVGAVDKSHAMAVSSARKTTGCPWSLERRPQESPDPNRQSAPMPVQNGVEQAHPWRSCVATYYSRYVLLRVYTHWFTLPLMQCTCIRVRSGTAQLVPITVAVCAVWESANSVVHSCVYQVTTSTRSGSEPAQSQSRLTYLRLGPPPLNDRFETLFHCYYGLIGWTGKEGEKDKPLREYTPRPYRTVHQAWFCYSRYSSIST